MKNNDLNSKTIDQLLAKLRVNKVVSITLVVVLTLLTTSTIYGLITKEDTSTFIALFAVVCTCWSFVPFLYFSMKKIKTELKMRNFTD